MGLDFSDVLFDPDVAGETFSVIRRSVVVWANGRQTTSVVTTPGVGGAVTPHDPGDVTRAEDMASTSNTILVSTTFRLRAQAEGVLPDQILYDGITYTVKSVKRWGRMANMTKAVAVSEHASDPDPT